MRHSTNAHSVEPSGKVRRRLNKAATKLVDGLIPRGRRMNEDDDSMRRVKRARLAHGRFKTMKAASDRLSIAYSTYVEYENQDTPNKRPDKDKAEKIAKLFDVERRFGLRHGDGWLWIRGEEPKTTMRQPPITINTAWVVGQIDMRDRVHLYPNDKITDTVELPPGASSSTVALEVREGNMRAIERDGYVYYFEDERLPPTEALYGKRCVVELDDGLIVMRTLRPGREKDRYDLEHETEPTLRDRRVAWAAKIIWLKFP